MADEMNKTEAGTPEEVKAPPAEEQTAKSVEAEQEAAIEAAQREAAEAAVEAEQEEPEEQEEKRVSLYDDQGKEVPQEKWLDRIAAMWGPHDEKDGKGQPAGTMYDEGDKPVSAGMILSIMKRQPLPEKSEKQKEKQELDGKGNPKGTAYDSKGEPISREALPDRLDLLNNGGEKDENGHPAGTIYDAKGQPVPKEKVLEFLGWAEPEPEPVPELDKAGNPKRTVYDSKGVVIPRTALADRLDLLNSGSGKRDERGEPIGTMYDADKQPISKKKILEFLGWAPETEPEPAPELDYRGNPEGTAYDSKGVIIPRGELAARLDLLNNNGSEKDDKGQPAGTIYDDKGQPVPKEKSLEFLGWAEPVKKSEPELDDSGNKKGTVYDSDGRIVPREKLADRLDLLNSNSNEKDVNGQPAGTLYDANKQPIPKEKTLEFLGWAQPAESEPEPEPELEQGPELDDKGNLKGTAYDSKGFPIARESLPDRLDSLNNNGGEKDENGQPAGTIYDANGQPVPKEKVLEFLGWIPQPAQPDPLVDQPGAESTQVKPAEGPGTTRDDIAGAEADASETNPKDAYYCWSENGGDSFYYKGPLGEFEFDPKQFSLAVMHLPESEHGAEKDVMFLKYIGQETNGQHIHVPEGIRDASYMFSGTDIQVAPQLPDSVRYAQRTFMSCPKLEIAQATLPESLEEGQLMFADCPRLVVGPRRLPDGMKHADYMFLDDTRLETSPKLGENLKSMDGAFAFCRNLKEKPSIPNGAQISMNNMTLGCDRLDSKTSESEAKKLHDQRNRAEKRINSVGFFGHVASVCSAIAQYHALRQQGYGLITAPYMVHQKRLTGEFGKNMSDMCAALSKKPSTRATWRQMSMNKDRKTALKRAEAMREWDEMHFLGMKTGVLGLGMKQRRLDGEHDFKTDLFRRIQHKETSEQLVYVSSHYGKAGQYEANAVEFRSRWGRDIPDQAARKQMANLFLEGATENAAYYRAASDAIMDGTRGSVRSEHMKGLRKVMDLMNEPMLQQMKELQNEYQIFNEGDRVRMNQIMQSMGYKDPVFVEGKETPTAALDRAKQGTVELVQPENVTGPAPVRQEPEIKQEPAPEPQRETVKPPEAKNPEEKKPETKNPEPEAKTEQAGRTEPAASQNQQKPAADKNDTGRTDDKHQQQKDIQATPSGSVTAAEAALNMGRQAVKSAGSAFMDFVQRAGAAGMAAANAFVAYGKDIIEPEAEEQKEEVVISERNETGKDVASREEQVKVDEAVGRDRLLDAAENALKDHREKELDAEQKAQREKELDARLGGIGKGGQTGTGVDRDITD